MALPPTHPRAFTLARQTRTFRAHITVLSVYPLNWAALPTRARVSPRLTLVGVPLPGDQARRARGACRAGRERQQQWQSRLGQKAPEGIGQTLKHFLIPRLSLVCIKRELTAQVEHQEKVSLSLPGQPWSRCQPRVRLCHTTPIGTGIS